MKMRANIVIILILALLLIVFALQNTQVVDVRLWFWVASIPRALLIFVCFALGVITGLIIPVAGRKNRKVKPKPEDEDMDTEI